MAKNKGGRPRADIDLHQLKQLMRLLPTLNDTAAFFDVHPDTIEKLIKREFKMSFPEFREQNMAHTRLNLKRKIIQEALKEKANMVALIFALKNLCGWKDKPDEPDEEDSTERKFILAYEVKPKDAHK